MSLPFSASAISWTRNGLAVVLAPIQTISTPYSRQSSTCFSPATSVATFMPSSFFTLCSHLSPGVPTPSNVFGWVRGFQIPARKTLTPNGLSPSAVRITCSSDSALHGPATRSGRCPSGKRPHCSTGKISNSVSILSPFCHPVREMAGKSQKKGRPILGQPHIIYNCLKAINICPPYRILTQS